MKTQLFLDVGGVLGTNLDGFWHRLAEAAEVSHEEIRRRYKRDLRDTLWTGGITEPGFWDWVCAQQSVMKPADARTLLLSHLQPMPAYRAISKLGESYDLHVLSNHRAEWLTPFLAPIRSHFHTVTVSSETGCAKPSADIYKLASAGLPPEAPILFVDDAEHNLQAAATLGWSTLLADPNSEWLNSLISTK